MFPLRVLQKNRTSRMCECVCERERLCTVRVKEKRNRERQEKEREKETERGSNNCGDLAIQKSAG